MDGGLKGSTPSFLFDRQGNQVWEMGKVSEDGVLSKHKPLLLWAASGQPLPAGGAPSPQAQVLVGVAHLVPFPGGKVSCRGWYGEPKSRVGASTDGIPSQFFCISPPGDCGQQKCFFFFPPLDPAIALGRTDLGVLYEKIKD